MKKELPVSHQPGTYATATIDMNGSYTYNYSYQIYFNLKNNTVVGKNLKTSWDFGFETSANGYHVILNMANAMFAYNTGKTVFTDVTDTSGFSAHKWDASSGGMDSTAIGDWRTTKPVYVINRGYTPSGSNQGMCKIQFLSVDANSYQVRFAQINGSGDMTLTIPKDSAYNFTFLSFASKATVMVEPPKATWDLVFTQYTDVFYNYNPPLPYLVTGCLLNRYNTKAILDSSILFSAVNYAYAQNKTLSSSIDVIGYDWKTYSFASSSYALNSKMDYIIQNSEGLFFKVHFIGYYNSSGREGNPQWEYQKL